MKICPQCDFIYEDDQRFCDMDGKELACDPLPVVVAGNPLSESSKGAISLRSRTLAVAGMVVLTSVLAAVYFAGGQQTRSQGASESSSQASERSIGQTPDQSTSKVANVQPSEFDQASAQTPRAEGSDPSAAENSLPPKEPVAPARLGASPVSTQSPTGNGSGPVIVRLNNGASIEADEAWETKEGIWYRKAGVVTFLNRRQVRSIERLATSASSKPVGKNAVEKQRKKDKAAARTELRLTRLEPADPKKQSRVRTFLKKTGRILKRPFKL